MCILAGKMKWKMVGSYSVIQSASLYLLTGIHYLILVEMKQGGESQHTVVVNELTP